MIDYDEAFPVGRDAHIAPEFSRRPGKGRRGRRPLREVRSDLPGIDDEIHASCKGRRGRRPLRRVRCGFGGICAGEASPLLD